MTKLSQLIYVFIFGCLLLGCTGSKNISTERIHPGLNVKTVINQYNENTSDFTTLAARIQVDYNDGHSSNRIAVNLRMKQDEIVWASASVLGFPVAKLLITPERVSYYESIDNTYFDGHFALLSEWLGVETNYPMVENLLLGNAVFELDPKTYELSTFENSYMLKPEKNTAEFQHAIYLNEFFKVKRQQVFQHQAGRVLTVDYPEYQQIKNKFFPKKIKLEVREPEGVTQIQIEYRSIDLEASVSFPFDIPTGYQQITFE